MAKPKIKMAMVLIPANEVMSDFCYNYARALFKKLSCLAAEGRVFKDETGSRGSFTDIAYATLRALRNQINSALGTATSSDRKEFNEFMATAEEFLGIFEAKVENQHQPAGTSPCDV
jgi:hypothetical protein